MTDLPTVDQLRDPAQYRRVTVSLVEEGMIALDDHGNVWRVGEVDYGTGNLLWRPMQIVPTVNAWRAGRGHEFYAEARAEQPEQSEQPQYDHEPCCTACGGTGFAASGPCFDCYGTGHPHPPGPSPVGSLLPHMKDGELVMTPGWQAVASAYLRPGDWAIHRNYDRTYEVIHVMQDDNSVQWATAMRPHEWRSTRPYYFVRKVEQPDTGSLQITGTERLYTEPTTVQHGLLRGVDVTGEWPIRLGTDTGLDGAVAAFDAVRTKIKALLAEATKQREQTHHLDRRIFARDTRVAILTELDGDLRKGLQNLWIVQRRPYVLDAGSMLTAAQYATAAGVAHRVLHELASVLVDADPDLLILATTGKRKELH